MDTATEDPKVAAQEAAMQQAGVATHTAVAVDYFGFEETHSLTLPDGVQTVQHQTLNEGGRTKYLRETNRDVRLQKTTGDAILSMSPGDERHALVKAAVVGWSLVRGAEKTPVPFNDKNLNDFLKLAPPSVIDAIEKDIRLKNPWLMAEVSVEDIDKEIASLEELRATKVAESEGNAAS